MIIGLTGGSGTGKSTACRYFENRGLLVIDSDKIAREICEKGEPCLREIADFFGKEVLDESGRLMRRTLGKIVFSDSKKLEKLNEITHKYIAERIRSVIYRNSERDIVIDAPLLFEAGLGDICTIRLCVLASKEIRMARIVERDGISQEQALNRISSQKSDEYYISRCEYCVYNDGDVEQLAAKLSEAFDGII
ncbi:MAG: dephospho-CoA kinase [Clostridia bacterium]|nr:dephospho-CoA kinase [Clostridia bacterium]